jgi:hypothetical protein
MCRLLLVASILLGACAHQPAAVPVSVQLMARCAATCKPAKAVAASVIVDGTDDLWQCLCRPVEMMTSPGT